MRFEHTVFLWALAAVPLLIILFISIRVWKKKAMKCFGESDLMQQMAPMVSSGKALTKFIFFSLAYISLVIALANPQIGSKMEEVKREGIDIMIALDVSNSMLAEDLQPNRLESAKLLISKLIDRLKNDRLGIVIFGGQAYTQLPITTDYGAAKLFLNTINTNMIPTQGTAIGAAIELATESFDLNSSTSKTIFVITDGENFEDDAEGAAESAAKEDITVHTIGMGSSKGAPIPIYKRRKQSGFKKDKEGNPVVTKLNEEMLTQIASAGEGVYVRAKRNDAGGAEVINPTAVLKPIFAQIDKMDKTEYDSKVYSDFEDRFQYFLALALFFLLIEFLLSEKKNKWLASINIFEVKKK